MVSALAILPMTSTAALITWGNSVDLYDTVAAPASAAVDQSFVSTNGSGVVAFNGQTAAAATNTLNGVLFTSTNSATLNAAGYAQGGVTVTSVGFADTGTAFGSGSFTDTDITAILQGGLFNASTITLNGLTAGYTYEIQVISNDSRTTGGRSTNGTDWVTVFSDGTQSVADSITAGSSATSALSNRDPLDSYSGENSGHSILGTFIAGAGGTQAFSIAGSTNGGTTLNSSGRAQINAFQLRLIAVPEPSSTALLGLGGLALIMRRRK